MAQHPTTFLPMAAGYPSLMGHHRHLLDDRVRTKAFLRAIAEQVKPDDVVLDLGTGSGILAFAARRAGARSVWAIDHDPIVQVAAAVARENGIDGITFVERPSREVVPGEPIDVLVSECFGPFGIGGTMIRAFTEMRARALAPNGRVIPRSVSLYVAPVEDRALASFIGAFAKSRDGIDWSIAHQLATNNVYNTTFARKALLAEAHLATLDLATASYRGSLDAEVEMVAARAGTIHAFAGWFDADLGAGVTLTTAPGKPSTIWRQVAFPLPYPRKVKKGTPIKLAIRCHEGANFDWAATIGDDPVMSSSTRYSHPAALIMRAPRSESSDFGENKPITASIASRKRSSREP